MKPRTFVFPILALLAATGIWFFFQGTEKPLDTGGGAGAGAAVGESVGTEADKGKQSEVEVDNPARRVAADEVQSLPASYTKHLSGLSGRILWKDSKEPVAGVEVLAIEAEIDAIVPTLENVAGLIDHPDPVLFRSKTRTDAKGRFVLRGVHPRSFKILGIGLATDRAALRFVDDMPSSGEVSELGDILLLERGTVSGMIVDSNGQPVPGARVRVADVPSMFLQLGVSHYEPDAKIIASFGPLSRVISLPSWVKKYDALLPFGDARSGQDGSFVVKGVRPGPSTLLVQKDGFSPFSKSLRVRSLKESKLNTVRLQRGTTLRGRFVDGEGKGVSGIKVFAGGKMSVAPIGFMRGNSVSNAEGRFVVQGLPRGKLWVGYQREAGEPWESSGPHRSGDEIEIKLAPRNRSAIVKVVDAKGDAVREAVLRVGPDDEPAHMPGLERWLPRSRIVEKKDEPGTFVVSELEPIEYRVFVRAKGFALNVAQIDVEKRDRHEIKVQLAPAPTIKFVAKSTRNEPIEAAKVYWNADRGKGRNKSRDISELPILIGRTDAKGELVVDHIEVGATRFFCRHPGWALAGSGDQKTSAERPIVFTMRRGGHVKGYATDGGKPLDGATIVCAPGRVEGERVGLAMPRMVATKPDGSFEFRNLDPGRWHFLVGPNLLEQSTVRDYVQLAQRFRPGVSADAKVFEGRTTNVRLDKKSSNVAQGVGSIVGRVRLSGRPIEGAQVRGYRGGGFGAVTDAAGTFEITGLPDGDHYIHVQASSDIEIVPDTLWQGTVKIKNGSRETLNIDYDVSSIEFEVVDEQATLLEGYVLQLRGGPSVKTPGRGSTRLRAITNAQGVAKFPRVPVGKYMVSSEGDVEDHSTIVRSRSVEIGLGQNKLIRLEGVRPIRVTAKVELDLNGLSEEDKKLALEHRPRWIEARDGPHRTWATIRDRKGDAKVEFRRLPPGRYTLVSWSRVRWEAAQPVVLEHGRDPGIIKLRPNKKSLDGERKRREAKAKKKNPKKQ